jgi:hypothetical protein
MCDQVVALLSGEQSGSLEWGDEDGNTESVVSRPGFQVIFSYVVGPSNAKVNSEYNR